MDLKKSNYTLFYTTNNIIDYIVIPNLFQNLIIFRMLKQIPLLSGKIFLPLLGFCHPELDSGSFLLQIYAILLFRKMLKQVPHDKFQNFCNHIKSFFYKYILKRKYYRYGYCNRCGDCCSKIYVKHKSNIISDETEFKKLQKIHPFYASLEIVDKDNQGLVFKCNKFDKDNRKCTIHFFRSAICRKYPSEEIFKFNGVMSENCGFYFKPIESFADVLKKTKRKNKRKWL